MLGNTTESLDIGDLPIVAFDMRATHLFQRMRNAMKYIKPTVLGWKPKPGSGWQVGIRLFKLNSFVLLLQIGLAAFAAVMYYAPTYFLKRLVAYLEADPERLHMEWGVVFALGLLITGLILNLGGCPVSRFARVRMFNVPFSIQSALVHQFHNSSGQVACPTKFYLVRQDARSKGPRFHRIGQLNRTSP